MELLEEVKSYLNDINEIRAGLVKRPPEKPESIRLYESVKRSSLPIVAGGFVDQPYLFSLIYEAIDREVAHQEYLLAAQIKAAAK